MDKKFGVAPIKAAKRISREEPVLSTCFINNSPLLKNNNFEFNAYDEASQAKSVKNIL